MPAHRKSRSRRKSVGTGTAALSLGACLCAGQLLSMAPAMAATPAVEAAPVVKAAALASVKPKITEAVSSRSIGWGKQVKVTAKLIDPRTGKFVTKGSIRFQAYRNGKWVNWGAARKVSATGYTSIYAAPKVSGYFRADYLGGSGYSSNVSARTYVTVRADGAKVLAEAKSHTGALYKFAAAGPSRFDCSGFTEYVYKKAAGKSLPHKANSQQRYGTGVSKSSMKVGDLIIFRSGSYGYHAAIYAGGGYMYDSPHTGARVGKHKIYGSNYVVRRLVAA